MQMSTDADMRRAELGTMYIDHYITLHYITLHYIITSLHYDVYWSLHGLRPHSGCNHAIPHFDIIYKAVFRYCCLVCPSCPAHMNSIDCASLGSLGSSLEFNIQHVIVFVIVLRYCILNHRDCVVSLHIVAQSVYVMSVCGFYHCVVSLKCLELVCTYCVIDHYVHF